MCGRATLTKDELDELGDELEADYAPSDLPLYRRRYNVAPSDLHWVVEPGAQRRVLVPAVWGYLAAGRPLINVRGESVGGARAAVGRGLREAFLTRRCLVVTDGFFEWDPGHAPHWFHRGDGGLVLLAGLAQHPPGDAAGGGGRTRFTILTTRPNRLVAAIHDRMPVVVPPDRIDQWLTGPPAVAAALIAPAPEALLVSTPVSRRVNSVKNDDPDCLTPAPEGAERDPEPVQRSLF
jgi:putative SOS response-associated peptidase YedK